MTLYVQGRLSPRSQGQKRPVIDGSRFSIHGHCVNVIGSILN